jgi:hypothetical protein
MLVPFAIQPVRTRPNGQVLGEILAQHGPLPLRDCLRYATEIVSILRELHDDGCVHGTVNPATIAIEASGATLLPTEQCGYADPLADLIGFGAVLYAMLTGRKPAGDELRLVPCKPAGLNGAAAVRASAMRLAERCLTAERETAPDLQKILTEVRLLRVMSKQAPAEQPGLFLQPPPGLSYAPPQPLAAFSGSAAPVMAPPAAHTQWALVAAPTADPAQPGEHSLQTRRAKRSHSRPVLQDVACPKCKGFHVRLSRPRTTFERIINLFGMGIYRCHHCFYRYVPFFGRKFIQKSQ